MAYIINKTNPYSTPMAFEVKREDFYALSAPYTIEGRIADTVNMRIFGGRLYIDMFGRIERIEECDSTETQIIIPGFVDSHVHIESSMTLPSEFARAAVSKGVIAAVCDPHEIANVSGEEGIRFMIDNGKRSGFKFAFAAPSCVPASDFENSGARLGPEAVSRLLKDEDIYLLGEMMNYPGVIGNNPETAAKISAAKACGKPVDGHSPTLSGENLRKYVNAGISTDHECSDLCEAEEKLALGMKIQIREGSAAKNFEALYPLIDQYPSSVMLCSDDIHPDDMQTSYLDSTVRRAMNKGLNFFNIMSAVSINPVHHYKLPVGLLREGDPADFIVIDKIEPDFRILAACIDGRMVYEGVDDEIVMPRPVTRVVNRFHALPVTANDIRVSVKSDDRIRIIEVKDKELYTRSIVDKVRCENGFAASDIDRDVLKIVVLNRYSENSKPVVGFIKGFGLKFGAIAGTVAHDSHNIVAVGVDDDSIVRAMNAVIKSKGGICAVENENVSLIELPVAGLISTGDINTVASEYRNLHETAVRLGSKLTSPFMTMSFMSLTVIPELKISDKGLFDSKNFRFTDLTVIE